MSLFPSSRRALKQCYCHCSQGTRSASTSTRPSLWQRIKQGADRAAVNVRPVPARVQRELEKQDVQEHGGGSIFQRADALMQAQSHAPIQTASPIASTSTSSPAQAWTEHKTSTGNIPISPRKLNDVARLIARMPIDHAILQMQMSDKRVAKTRIKSMLVLARDHAVMKGLAREKLHVREAWVSKGVYLKRLDIKGRGRHGIIMKPESRMHVVLAHGPSRAEQKQAEFDKRLKQALRTGAGYVREDKKIINMNNLKGSGVTYAW